MKKNFFGVLTALGISGAMLAVFLALQEAAPGLDLELDLAKLKKNYVSEGSAGETETEESDSSPLGIRIDFRGLKEINEDIVGWIYIPDTQINYPVLQHDSDNVYYLHHSFQGEENVLGSIYIYSGFSADFTDSHTVLFGHNMASGQMFGGLSDYSERAFLEEHREVYLYLPDRSLQCTVYSAHSCSVYDPAYRDDYEYGTKPYEQFIRHTKEAALWESDLTPSGDDTVITLSTCTDEGDASRRFVVHCMVTKTKKIAADQEKEEEINGKKI